MKSLGHKIIKIARVSPQLFEIRIRFNDGLSGTVSLKHLFESPRGLCREILRGNMFSHCFVEAGALAWPNGFELCPDMIRHLMIEQTKKIAA